MDSKDLLRNEHHIGNPENSHRVGDTIDTRGRARVVAGGVEMVPHDSWIGDDMAMENWR